MRFFRTVLFFHSPKDGEKKRIEFFQRKDQMYGPKLAILMWLSVVCCVSYCSTIKLAIKFQGFPLWNCTLKVNKNKSSWGQSNEHRPPGVARIAPVDSVYLCKLEKKNTHKKIYSPAAPDAGSSGVGNGSCAHSVHFIINIVASWGFNAVCCFFFFRRFVSSEKCPTDRGKESTRARMYVRREHEQGSWNSRTEPALSASVSRSCYREPCQCAVCKSAAVCCGIVVSVCVCVCVFYYVKVYVENWANNKNVVEKNGTLTKTKRENLKRTCTTSYCWRIDMMGVERLELEK